MMDKITIYERLEIFASKGDTSANLKLWKSQIEKLEREGFIIHIIAETERKAEFYCEISWKNPIISGRDAEKMLMYTIKVLNSNISDKRRADLPSEYEPPELSEKVKENMNSIVRSPYF